MKISKRQLSQIILETLRARGALMNEDLTKQLASTLSSNYDVVDEDERYPYGRNRGDVKRTTTYVRKDGQPVTPEDIAVFTAKEQEQSKDSMAGLKGIYKHGVSSDGVTLTMHYNRHTAG